MLDEGLSFMGLSEYGQYKLQSANDPSTSDVPGSFQETDAQNQPALSVCPVDTMDLLGDGYHRIGRCRAPPGVFLPRSFEKSYRRLSIA